MVNSRSLIDNTIKNKTLSVQTKLVSKKSIVLSYELNSNVNNFITLQKNETSPEITFIGLADLVKPYTNIKSEGKLSTKGVFFGNYIDETYSIQINESYLSFTSIYENIPKRTIGAVATSDSIVKFAVIAATGIFNGATLVEIEYTSNEYESRIITVYF